MKRSSEVRAEKAKSANTLQRFDGSLLADLHERKK
jgi:hypothetical protein